LQFFATSKDVYLLFAVFGEAKTDPNKPKQAETTVFDVIFFTTGHNYPIDFLQINLV
jgi:hypothetical protein